MVVSINIEPTPDWAQPPDWAQMLLAQNINSAWSTPKNQ